MPILGRVSVMGSILFHHGAGGATAVDDFFRLSGRVTGIKQAIAKRFAPVHGFAIHLCVNFPHRIIAGRGPFMALHPGYLHGRIPGGCGCLPGFRSGDGEGAGFGEVEDLPYPLLEFGDGLQAGHAFRQGVPETLPGDLVDVHHLDELFLEHADGRAVGQNEVVRVGPQPYHQVLAGLVADVLPEGPGDFLQFLIPDLLVEQEVLCLGIGRAHQPDALFPMLFDEPELLLALFIEIALHPGLKLLFEGALELVVLLPPGAPVEPAADQDFRAGELERGRKNDRDEGLALLGIAGRRLLTGLGDGNQVKGHVADIATRDIREPQFHHLVEDVEGHSHLPVFLGPPHLAVFILLHGWDGFAVELAPDLRTGKLGEHLAPEAVFKEGHLGEKAGFPEEFALGVVPVAVEGAGTMGLEPDLLRRHLVDRQDFIPVIFAAFQIIGVLVAQGDLLVT